MEHVILLGGEEGEGRRRCSFLCDMSLHTSSPWLSRGITIDLDIRDFIALAFLLS